MKDIRLSKHDDLNIFPSDELKERTLTEMKNRKMSPAKSYGGVRKPAVCAALVCAAVVLMGVGVRVFDYIAYVPGMGTVTQDQDKVYTLERTVDGEYRIEALSMIPVTEGENKGLWKVTLLTTMDVSTQAEEDPESVEPIYLTNEDGETFELNYAGDMSSIGSRFTGYAEIGGAGEYTVAMDGEDYTVTMKSLENSEWANYSYPVDQGITAVMFPLAECSPYMAFNLIVEPESENMAYWLSHSEEVWARPAEIVITDTAGNTYKTRSASTYGISVPDEDSFNSLLSYEGEIIMGLDRVPEAPIAKIEITQMMLEFENITDVGSYTVTVPELGEVVEAADLPNNGVFIDTHGVKLEWKSITTEKYEDTGVYNVVFEEADTIHDFEEDIWSFNIDRLVYAENEDAEFIDASYHGSRSTETGEYIRQFYMNVVGDGVKKEDSVCPDVSFGEELVVRLNQFEIILNGNWTIDFTEPSK